MRSLPAILALSLIACGGGGPGRLVAAASPAALRPDDGLLIVASESDRTTLRLCRNANEECAVVGPTPPDGATLVYAFPEGRWCVTHVSCEPQPGDIAQHEVPEDEVLCIDVTAQQIAYPGHVHFDRSIEADMPCAGRATFLLHHDLDVEIARAHPGLNAPHVTLAPPTPMRGAAH